MKTKTLFTALALIIGLQFTNAQQFINEDQLENKLDQLDPTLISSTSSDWEIVTYEGTQNNLHAIQFIDEDHGWAVGSYGTVINTTDGGLTWYEQTVGYTIDLQDLLFLDENTGFIIGTMYVGPHLYGVVNKTYDGGLSWELSFMSESPMIINSITFVDDQNGFITASSYDQYGSNGIIIKTTDTGENWEVVTPGNAITDIDNIVFTDKDVFSGMTIGWATAKINIGPSEVSVILKSVDFGSTWNTNFITTGEMILEDLKFFDSQNGIAIGSEGYVLLTNNTGNTWTTIKTSQNNLSSIIASKDNFAYVVGNNGTILSTNNKGQNWSKEFTPVKKDLTSICSTPYGDIWVVGSEGTILYKPYSGIGEISTVNQQNKSTQINQFSNLNNEKDNSPLSGHMNYPNPFTSKTTISFELDKQAHVKLEIYSSNGKLISTLKDQDFDAGYYEVQFEAHDLPSGIYTYVLVTGNHIENGKMIK